MELPTNNLTQTMPTDVLLAMLTFTDQRQLGTQYRGVVAAFPPATEPVW
jgi:hypothetical protein